MKVIPILILIPFTMILVGCSGSGDEPGPALPSANSPAGIKAAEDGINNAPPELQERIRAERAKSMAQAGPPANAKK